MVFEQFIVATCRTVGAAENFQSFFYSILIVH